MSIADFGAGGGGYARLFNETGLVVAQAFDGTPDVTKLSGGAVQHLALEQPQDLGGASRRPLARGIPAFRWRV